MSDLFPIVVLKGGPEERGRKYGQACRDLIVGAVEYYECLLFPAMQVAPGTVRTIAEKAGAAIERFSRSLCAEIHGVAVGAGLDPWRIFALNARTEIVNASTLPVVSECTTYMFSEAGVLGQNWDWTQTGMDHSVILDASDPNGRRTIILTEAGMVGKLGLNSEGLALCINILGNKHSTIGVPIHALTRELLSAADVAEARGMIARAGQGRSSHILLADPSGAKASFEFAGETTFELPLSARAFVHTNHCIAPDSGPKAPSANSSTMERLRRARDLASSAGEWTTERLFDALADQDAGIGSLNVQWMPSATLKGQTVGTCATIVMNPSERSISIRKGPYSASRGNRMDQTFKLGA